MPRGSELARFFSIIRENLALEVVFESGIPTGDFVWNIKN